MGKKDMKETLEIYNKLERKRKRKLYLLRLRVILKKFGMTLVIYLVSALAIMLLWNKLKITHDPLTYWEALMIECLVKLLFNKPSV